MLWYNAIYHVGRGLIIKLFKMVCWMIDVKAILTRLG